MEVAEAGLTVTTSWPLGVPDNPRPRVYTLPEIAILVGVADMVATPPLRLRAKSAAVNAEVAAPDGLRTASEKVTDIVELSAASVVAVIVGDN